MFEFEYDPNKSRINKSKHGIDFEEAKALFCKEMIFYPAKEVKGEKRYILHSFIDDKCYSAIFTIRNHKIRIISVRRCRDEEKSKAYRCK